jgi:hypothetical protein
MKKFFILIIVIVLAITGIGFSQYQNLKKDTTGVIGVDTLVSSVTRGYTADSDIAYIRGLVTSLDGVSRLQDFDPGFLNSVEFNALQDFSVILSPAEGVGRSNPFESIGVADKSTIQQKAPEQTSPTLQITPQGSSGLSPASSIGSTPVNAAVKDSATNKAKSQYMP